MTTLRQQLACPACGLGSWRGPVSWHDDRPIAYRIVEFGGRGCIRVVQTVHIDELPDDLRELGEQARVRVARLADALGLILDAETNTQVKLAEAKQDADSLIALLHRVLQRQREQQHSPRMHVGRPKRIRPQHQDSLFSLQVEPGKARPGFESSEFVRPRLAAPPTMIHETKEASL